MTPEQRTKTEKSRVEEWLPKIAEALGGKQDKYTKSVKAERPDCIIKILFFGECPTVYLFNKDGWSVGGKLEFDLTPREMFTDPQEGVVVFKSEFGGFTHTLSIERTGLITQTITPHKI